MVSRIDPQGSLLFLSEGPVATVAQRVPVEGRYLDGSNDPFGPAVEILLHVIGGKLQELEVYKTDGSEIVSSPFEIDPALIVVHAAATGPS
jgi:hypothetical protein